jgi:HlyD family secretion protein
LGQLAAHRNQAEAEWNRAQKLRAITVHNVSPTGDKLSAMAQPIKAISDSDYDLAKANFEVAKSNVEVGEATLAQAQAALNLSETNLSYTTIKSPVKGTIIDRRVNVGQTVVSSLNSPSLFLIAKDLRQIQVWASVNEADIGRLKVGMPVNFTVDAFPNDVFRGKIAQIRLNATMTQNVVTYTVVIATDNADMKLLPYLTADLKFEVDNRKDVLLVPNSALRWQPTSADQIAPDARELAESPPKGRGKDAASGDRSASADKGDKGETTAEQASGAAPSSSAKPKRERTQQGTLWVKDGDYVRPVRVQVGATDSALTEVSGADLADGTEVVVGENKDRASEVTTTNPFAPQFGKGRGQGQKGQAGQGGQGQSGQGQGGQGGQGRGAGQGPRGN